MKKTAFIFWFILSSFCNLTAAGLPDGTGSSKRLTQYVVDQWLVKNGLPQNSVNTLLQARDGYLWFGTYEGLVRFNGKRFIVFDRSNTPEFRSNRITSLCEDRQGRLWIGTYGGGFVMRDETGFHRPVQDSSLGQYISLASLAADSLNRIWVISEKGVHILRDSSVEKVFPLSDFGGSAPASIVIDRRGRVWLWGYPFLYTIDRGGVRRIASKHAGRAFTAAVPSRTGAVWIFEYSADGSSRVCRFNDTLEYVSSIPRPVSSSSVSPVFEDRHGVLWCYAKNGIAAYRNGTWDHLEKGDNVAVEHLQVVAEDTEENIWIGTNGSGLIRLRDTRFTPIGIAEGLLGENIWAVFEDSRRTKWIGTLGGGGWCYTIDRRGIRRVTNSAGIYFCFLEDREGNVWLEGESIVAPDGKRTVLPSSFRSSVMALDSMGNIWLSPWHGGIYIVHNKKIVDSISLGISSADASIRTMKAGRDGSMWIGTQEGLFHCRGKKIIRYTTADGLPNNWIRSLYQDETGILWIATDGGLAKRMNGRFYSYTVDNGLHSNTIHVILEDAAGKLWMSSNKGLFVIDKKDVQLFDEGKANVIRCIVYGEEDGMRSAEGNGSYQQGGWRMRDGTLWFATIKGIAVVDPDNLKINRVVPPVLIERMIVNGADVPVRSDAYLAAPVNDLSFHFSALSFRVPSRVRYRYMLEGFHTEWIDAGDRTSAAFTRLPAGEYRFRVIACNDDGLWNTAGASVRFTLPAPFWRQWWFYGAVVLMLLGVVAAAVRYIELRKIRHRITQLENERTLERERSRISKDMHDEVGSSLTQIAILSELAQRKEGNDVRRNLEKISAASRDIIDNIGQIIWAIDPKNDTLENLLAYTREYITETLELTAVRSRLHFPESVPDLKVSAEFRRNVFLTVKEALNNTVKYSGAGIVTVEAAVAAGRLSIVITDDGSGFSSQDVSRFGNGLNNMKKRIGDLHGTIVIESHPGSGTAIRAEVPITTFV